MKIGFAVDYLRPYVVGGAETSSWLAAKNLALYGHDVTVFTPNHKTYGHATDEDGYEWMGPVRIFRYWTPRAFCQRRGVNSIWTRNPLYHAYVARILKRHGRRLRLEILHAQTGPVQVPVYKAARSLKIPCVATIRDMHNICTIGPRCEPPCNRTQPCTFVNAMRCALSNSRNWKFLIDVITKYLDMRKRRYLLERKYDQLIFPARGYRDLYRRHGFGPDDNRVSIIYNYPPETEIPYRHLRRRKAKRGQGVGIVQRVNRADPTTGD